MAVTDLFGEATVLDALSWVSLPFAARVAKLAHLYLKVETKIDDECRNYTVPVPRTVTPFIKSHYLPPRGEMGPLVEAIIPEVIRQKKIQTERARRRPYVWTQGKLSNRRNAVSSGSYRIVYEDLNRRQAVYSNRCVAITRLAGCLLMIEAGDAYTSPRIYARQLATGKVKVFVLEGKAVLSFTSAMISISSKAILRGAYEGKASRFDFDAEAFEIDGVMVPFCNIRMVYVGKRAARSMARRPEKPTTAGAEVV